MVVEFLGVRLPLFPFSKQPLYGLFCGFCVESSAKSSKSCVEVIELFEDRRKSNPIKAILELIKLSVFYIILQEKTNYD